MSETDDRYEEGRPEPPAERPGDNPEEEVGYCRPPKKHRFQKGDGGNRKGRRKGRRNFLTDLRESLAETVEITKAGKPRKITMQQALIRGLLASASKNPRAAAILLARIEQLDASEAPAAESKLSPEEQAMLDLVKAMQPTKEGSV